MSKGRGYTDILGFYFGFRKILLKNTIFVDDTCKIVDFIDNDVGIQGGVEYVPL